MSLSEKKIGEIVHRLIVLLLWLLPVAHLFIKWKKEQSRLGPVSIEAAIVESKRPLYGF